MDKIAAMKAFVRVVEAGTFTRAAESQGVPKAQVSRLVQSLEDELQTQLLNRTTRRVTVTLDGAAYYERAARLLDQLEELESSLSRGKAAPRGRLRVDMSSSIASHVVTPALHDFYARYPDIRIEIGVSDKRVDLIGENVVSSSSGSSRSRRSTRGRSGSATPSKCEKRLAIEKPSRNEACRSPRQARRRSRRWQSTTRRRRRSLRRISSARSRPVVGGRRAALPIG